MTLASLLETHRSRIAADWAARARAGRGSGYANRPAAEIEAWAAHAIDAVIQSELEGSASPLRERATAISRSRAEQGFEIEEVVDGLLLLHETALAAVLEHVGGDQTGAKDAAVALDRSMRVMVAHFAKLFADEMRRAVQRQQEQEAVVEERQRLARELHDSVSQSLYGVGMCAEAAARRLEAGDSASAVAHLREVRDSARDALGEMRFLVFDLRPPILSEEGLVRALRARLGAVESRAGLAVDLSADEGAPWPPAIAEALYGIAREALNNVVKHARATRVAVRLAREADGSATLAVEDDGAGFDTADPAGLGGLGLGGMRERAGRIGASLSVSSRPGGGTAVRVAVPAARAGDSLEPRHTNTDGPHET